MSGLEPRIYVPGETIFKANDKPDALYFIHAGQVEILDKKNTVIATLEEGAFFGEMALLKDSPRSATAKAVSFCDIYLLHKSKFNDAISAHPKFKAHIEKVVQNRLQKSA